MKKPKKRYTVYTEDNVQNSNREVVKQSLIYYFASDSAAMATSIAVSLRQINHSFRIIDNHTGQVHQEWIREGFHVSELQNH
jgi:hypothetical protein